jgi:hypothetical protein
MLGIWDMVRFQHREVSWWPCPPWAMSPKIDSHSRSRARGGQESEVTFDGFSTDGLEHTNFNEMMGDELHIVDGDEIHIREDGDINGRVDLDLA